MQPLIYSAQAALDGVGWRRGGREVTYFENGVTRRDDGTDGGEDG